MQNILEQAKQGDRRAWEQLFQPLQRPIVSFLRRFLTAEDAADVAQEAFVQAMRKIDQLQSAEQLRPWLFRIAYRKMLDLQKSAYKSRQTSLDQPGEIATTNNDPKQIFDAEERKAELLTLIERLPPAQRQVVWLRMREDMPFRQIAEVVGKPLNTVLGHMHQAKQTLKNYLSEEGAAE